MRKILLASLLFFSAYVRADVLRSEDEVRNFTEGVMGSISTNNLDSAFKQIALYFLLPEPELLPIKSQLQLQIPNLLRQGGDPVGFEFIESKKKGSSLISMVYLAKYEKYAIQWTFYFYKTPKGWMLNTFRYDDGIRRIFSD